MARREVKRMSGGQTRTHSGRKILERCKEKHQTENVAFIDVDNGKFNNVIIIDVPESSRKRFQGSKVLGKNKKLLSSCVISIDDDKGSDEADSGSDDAVGGDQGSDATSSKAPFPSFSQSCNSEESDSGECQFIQEEKFPLKLSRCKRTYSGKTLPRNRFGLSPICESSSSESDSSDCEIMEGSSGKIREEWERAAFRKRISEDDAQNGQSALEDHASASASSTDTPKNVDRKNMAEQHDDAPFCSASSNANDRKEKLSTSTATGDGIRGDPFLEPEGADPVPDLNMTVDQDGPSWCKTQSCREAEFSHRNAGIQDRGKTFPGRHSFCHTESQSHTDVNRVGPNLQNREQIPGEPSLHSCQPDGESQFSYRKTCFENKGGKFSSESCWFNTYPRSESHCEQYKASFQDETASMYNDKKLDATQANQQKVVPCYKVEGIHQEPSFSNTQSPNATNYGGDNFKYKEQPVTGEPLCSNQLRGETQFNNGSNCSVDNDEIVLRESFSFKTQLQCDMEVISERFSCQDKEKQPFGDPFLSNVEKSEPLVNCKRACFNDEEEPTLEIPSDAQPQDERSPVLPARNGDDTHDIQNDVIGGREKFKETDEYRRASAEEWTSRQRQLQIQAEEAQRLRKRKRAQTQRLIDMEKRQKQRLEEMRETQKKDMETMNLKEQLRVEARKELDKLEMMCTDMASLLRGLGIHVGGGLYPVSHEVHAAYKQALLRFHPDRALRTDVHRQVEAEEKFKLISRLKEKLPLTS